MIRTSWWILPPYRELSLTYLSTTQRTGKDPSFFWAFLAGRGRGRGHSGLLHGRRDLIGSRVLCNHGLICVTALVWCGHGIWVVCLWLEGRAGVKQLLGSGSGALGFHPGVPMRSQRPLPLGLHLHAAESPAHTLRNLREQTLGSKGCRHRWHVKTEIRKGASVRQLPGIPVCRSMSFGAGAAQCLPLTPTPACLPYFPLILARGGGGAHDPLPSQIVSRSFESSLSHLGLLRDEQGYGLPYAGLFRGEWDLAGCLCPLCSAQHPALQAL